MAGRDKLAAPIGGRPLLAWTLERLAAAPEVGADRRRSPLPSGSPRSPLPIGCRARWSTSIAGGSRRQESVAAGVERLAREPRRRRHGSGHPGPGRGASARSRPSSSARSPSAAREFGAAIPVLAMAETVKRIADGPDRRDARPGRAGHGPDAPGGPARPARAGLRAAFRRAAEPTFTDEAGLLEACRIPVHAVPGDPMNLKVTVARGPRPGRGRPRRPGGPTGRACGSGSAATAHPFGPGAPLALGGIAIEGAPRLHGHSDGDVALHAVADALLGACGLGDLGRLFPAGPQTPAGIASAELLRAVRERVAAPATGRPRSTCDRRCPAAPRGAARGDARGDRRTAGHGPERVNVKASTGNLEGWEGRRSRDQRLGRGNASSPRRRASGR